MAIWVATLRQVVEADATRVPVGPVAAIACAADSVETLYVPLVAASQRSDIAGGGVKLTAPAHAPPKRSSVSETVVVRDGAVTDFDAVEPLLCPFEALMGAVAFAFATAIIPPDMSSPELKSVNV